MKVILGGIELTGKIEGLDSLSVTHNRSGANGVQTIAFSSEMSFYDDGYELIKTNLIDNPNGNLNALEIEIFDSCCDDAIFIGTIKGTNIEWCEDDCYVSAQAVELNDTEAQLKCLKSTIIHADKHSNSENPDNFKKQTFLQFTYCNEMRPQFIQDILIILSLFAELIHRSTSIISRIIGKIIGFLVGLFGDITGVETDGITTLLTLRQTALEQIQIMITGCGRRHPTPLVNQYIRNVCDICGVGFTSSILNDVNSEYHTLAYLNAPVKRGHIGQTRLLDFFGIKNTFDVIEDNLPLKTGTEFLDDLKPVFNAEWRIINGTLIFERKDYFNSSNVTWKTTGSMNITDGICYSWDGSEKPPASARFQYSEDLVDNVGDEARGLYNEIVSWQGSKNQEGIHEVNLSFGAARTRNDGIDRDVISFWNNITKNLPFIGDNLALAAQFNNSLIMQSGKTAFPKLILWDEESLFFNAYVKRDYNVSPYSNYLDLPHPDRPNYPMYFDANRNTQFKNLYEFHKIDDPRTQIQRNKTYEFEATFVCSDLDTFDISKNLVLPGNFVGTMETVVIDYSQKTLNIKGKV